MLHGHGGNVYEISKRLGIKPCEVLDFSSNISPIPPDSSFLEYLSSRLSEIRLLPQVDSSDLREALERRFSLPSGRFLVSSGTTSWIFLLPKALGIQRAVVPMPTYADYEDGARLWGLEVRYLGPYLPDDPMASERLLSDVAEVARQDSCLVYLCNPNNPTGHFIKPELILERVRDCHEAIWVVDESYVQFVGPDERTSLLFKDMPDNLVVLRSFSKIYGIPGLRLGYLVSMGLIDRIRPYEMPWGVSRLAQIAGQYLLERPEIEKRVRDFVSKETKEFKKSLSAISGLHLLASSAHFFLVRLDPPVNAPDLFKRLCERGILIRDCSNFKGLGPDYIRIAIKAENENQRLIDALRELVLA